MTNTVSEVHNYDDLIGRCFEWRWTLYCLGPALTVVLCLIAFRAPCGLVLLVAALIFVMIGVPMAIIAYFFPMRSIFPRVVTRMRDAIVVTTGERPKIIRLRDCYWYRGKSHEESPLFISRECIIIVFPGRIRFAVGLTPEAREMWAADLLASDATKMLDNDRPFQDMVLASCHIILAAVIGVVAGTAIQIGIPGLAWALGTTLCHGASGAFSGLAIASVIRFPYLGQSLLYVGTVAMYGIMGLFGAFFSGGGIVGALVTMGIFQAIGVFASWFALSALRRVTEHGGVFALIRKG